MPENDAKLALIRLEPFIGDEIKSFEIKDDVYPPWIIANVYHSLAKELANDIYRTANPFQVLVMKVDPKSTEQTPEEKIEEISNKVAAEVEKISKIFSTELRLLALLNGFAQNPNVIGGPSAAKCAIEAMQALDDEELGSEVDVKVNGLSKTKINMPVSASSSFVQSAAIKALAENEGITFGPEEIKKVITRGTFINIVTDWERVGEDDE